MKELLSLLRPFALFAVATILFAGGHSSFSAQSPDSREADETDIASEQSATAPSGLALAPGEQGLRVYRDPITGRFTTPPATVRLRLADRERQMLNRSSVGLQARTMPNGTVTLDLQGRFMNLLLATSRQAESLSVSCVQDAAEADACLRNEVEAHATSGDQPRDVR